MPEPVIALIQPLGTNKVVARDAIRHLTPSVVAIIGGEEGDPRNAVDGLKDDLLGSGDAPFEFALDEDVIKLIQVETINDPDRAMHEMLGAVGRAFRWAKQEMKATEVYLNLTGGTKPMTVGATLSCIVHQGLKPLYTFDPRHVEGGPENTVKTMPELSKLQTAAARVMNRRSTMRRRLIRELARLEDDSTDHSYPTCSTLAKNLKAKGRQAVNRPLNALELHGVVTHDGNRPRNYSLTDIGRILLAVID